MTYKIVLEKDDGRIEYRMAMIPGETVQGCQHRLAGKYKEIMEHLMQGAKVVSCGVDH